MIKHPNEMKRLALSKIQAGKGIVGIDVLCETFLKDLM